MKISFEEFYQLINSGKFLIKYKHPENTDYSEYYVYKEMLGEQDDKRFIRLYQDGMMLRIWEEHNEEILFDEENDLFNVNVKVYDEIQIGEEEEMGMFESYIIVPVMKKLETYKLIPFTFVFYKKASKNELFS